MIMLQDVLKDLGIFPSAVINENYLITTGTKMDVLGGSDLKNIINHSFASFSN